MYFLIAFVLLNIVFWLAILLNLMHEQRKVTDSKKGELQQGHPSISVILPIANLEESHGELLKTLNLQNYDDYEVVVVYTNRSIDQLPSLARVSFYENNAFSQAGSNKTSNMLCGYKKINQDTEYLVFIDDDILIDKLYLIKMADHLLRNRNSIISSYRFLSTANGLVEKLLLLVNNIFIPFMYFSRWRCIWGGSFGLSKKLFCRLDVVALWQNAVSDDLALTNCANAHKVKIIPTCFFVESTHFIDGIADLLGWASRQFTLARYYAPRNFADSFTVAFCTFFSLVAQFVLFTSSSAAIQMFSCLSLFATSGIFYLMYMRLGSKILYRESVIGFALLPLFVLIIMSVAFFKREIIWKQKTYVLKQVKNSRYLLKNTGY